MDLHLSKSIRNNIKYFLWTFTDFPLLFTISEKIQIYVMDENQKLIKIVPFDNQYSKQVISFIRKNLNDNRIFENNEKMDIKIIDGTIKFIGKNFSLKEFYLKKEMIKKSIQNILREFTMHYTCKLTNYYKVNLYAAWKI